MLELIDSVIQIMILLGQLLGGISNLSKALWLLIYHIETKWKLFKEQRK